MSGRKARIWEDLLIQYGLPPHDTWSNICAHDGYHATSLLSKYAVTSLQDLHDEVNFDRVLKKWKKARKLADSILKCPYK